MAESAANIETMDAPGVGAVSMPVDKPKLATPKSKDEFDALSPGSKFLDPEGAERVKPYMPKDAHDYSSIPEGSHWIDPEGQLQQKPNFESVGFTAQTLYDMAINPKEKKKALEFSYPGKVKEGPDGLYVEDDGKFLKPGHGVAAWTGGAASATAPVVGTILGAIGGGAVGSPSGPGAFLTGAAGGAGGALLGQSFNDVLLGLAGVYDRTPTEQLVNEGLAAFSGATGAGVGRGISAAVPSIKAGVSAASAALPRAGAYFLGATKDSTVMARELAEKGVMVPPSAWAPEAPHLQNMVEVFDPAFRTNKPLRESAVAHYEDEAGKILDQFGVEKPPSISAPKAEIPTRAAGEKIMQRTLAQSAEADQNLKTALERRAEELRAGLPDQIAQRESLAKAATDSRNQAQKLIDQGFKDIDGDVEKAFKVSESGHYGGDLWEHVGNKLRAIRQGIGQRATYWYDRYGAMTAGHSVNSQELSSSAQQMLDELPAEFKARNPTLVQKLAKLGAQTDEEGVVTKEAEQLTYGQLHDLRSVFRNSADWQTLSGDFKNGALKRFSNEIDRLIHDPNAPAEVRQAGKFLDTVDKWYAHNIKIFNAQQIKAVMRGLEAGEPADPKNLYNAIIKEGHTDLIERTRKMVGPNIWAGVKAADTKAMLDASKTLEEGVIDAKKFAREVLERKRAGTLEVVHGKDAEKLMAQARAIEQLDGRLPIPTEPTDTMTQVIQRARLAAEEAKVAGNRDPLGTLNKEMKKIKAEQSREMAKMKAERRNDPLGFLYDPTTGASAAVDKVLGSEDLILAAAARFGENSDEFKMLRQVYAQQVLTGTLNPSARMAAISPEIQQLMFPGTTLNQMQTLAKNMEFLMTSRGMGKTTAGSMSAMSKVEHPIGGRFLGPVITKVPVAGAAANAVARAGLGKFYALVTKLATSPATLRWVEKGLNGSAEERAAVKVFTDKVLQKGTAVGAGGAEATYQGASE